MIAALFIGFVIGVMFGAGIALLIAEFVDNRPW